MKTTYDLDPAQQAIVDLTNGLYLVLAGPGSGKTTCVSRRVARLVERGVLPENLLLLTFTNKAAKEMIERARSLVDGDLSKMTAGTFHSVAARLLRPVAERLGYAPQFGILDEEDATFLCKALVKQHIPPDCRAKAEAILSMHSFCRNTRTSHTDRMATHHLDWVPWAAEISSVIRGYEAAKRQQNVMDFDDLLVYFLEALKTFPDFRERLQQRFEFVMLDEAQDTNHLQWEILDLLIKKHRNLMLIGDLDQAIYSFRGADVDRFFEFLDRYPEAERYDLALNYRSNPPIVAMANASIACNQNRFERVGDPAKFGGPLPVVVEYQDEDEEAESIAWHIKKDHAYTHLDHIAVLYRAAHQSAKLQVHLARYGVPFVVKGGVPFFSKPHVKDVVAWFKAAANPQDKTSWQRVITMFPGLGPATFEKLWATIAADPLGLVATAKTKAKGWEAFLRTLDAFHSEWATGELRHAALAIGTGEAGEILLSQYSGDREEREDDLRELFKLIGSYPTAADFLEEMALVETQQDGHYGVQLSTIHGVKGLEYRHVYVLGLNEERFPSARGVEENLEEERRIFFVAVTRAIETLRLSYAETLYDFRFEPQISAPSRFLTELPEHLVDWRPLPATID